MHSALTRRRFLSSSLGGVCTFLTSPAVALSLTMPPRTLEALELARGGRLGVCVIDTSSGRTLQYRADERFLMCSTFKTILVAAILSRIERGAERLDHRLPYSAADLLDHAPFTRSHVLEGALSVELLCKAVIEVSDNTAANLLLASIGGPAALTQYARGLGDVVTRVDRNEPAANLSDGEFDTTTPSAMARTMRTLFLGEAIGADSRERLLNWMVSATPGLRPLRAGFPASWRVGDKAGTSDVMTNDVAIAYPPSGGSPIIVASYYEAPNMPVERREKVLQEAGSMIVGGWI